MGGHRFGIGAREFTGGLGPTSQQRHYAALIGAESVENRSRRLASHQCGRDEGSKTAKGFGFWACGRGRGGAQPFLHDALDVEASGHQPVGEVAIRLARHSIFHVAKLAALPGDHPDGERMLHLIRICLARPSRLPRRAIDGLT